MIQDVEPDLFQPELQTGGDVSISIGQQSTFRARWTKHLRVFIGKYSSDHRRAIVPGHVHALSVMAKVVKVQTKLPVRFSADNVAKLFDVARLPIRSQAHDLSFVAVVRKAKELGRRGVNNSGRVRIFNLAEDLDRLPFSHRPHGGNEIAEPIN